MKILENFCSKKIVVTGASSGIGRETAIKLSQLGAELFLLARRESELQKTMSLLSGEVHSYKVCDVSDFEVFEQCLKNEVKQSKKKFDGAVHAAGIGSIRPLRIMDLEYIQMIMGVHTNAFATILKVAASKRYFNDNSSIVGLSSCISKTGARGHSIYAASKAAMDSLAMSSAIEFKNRKIRVNTVCPELVATEMLCASVGFPANTLEEMPEDILKVEEVIVAIISLLSDLSIAITGENVNIGFTMETIHLK